MDVWLVVAVYGDNRRVICFADFVWFENCVGFDAFNGASLMG